MLGWPWCHACGLAGAGMGHSVQPPLPGISFILPGTGMKGWILYGKQRIKILTKTLSLGFVFGF